MEKKRTTVNTDLFNKFKSLKSSLQENQNLNSNFDTKISIDGLEIDEKLFNAKDLEGYLDDYVESYSYDNTDANFGSQIDKTVESVIDQYLKAYLIRTYGNSGQNNTIFSALATKSDKEVNRIMQYVDGIQKEIKGIGKQNQKINQGTFDKFMLKLDLNDYMIERIHEYAIRMYIDKLSSRTITRDVEYNRLAAQNYHKDYSETISETRDDLRELEIDLNYSNDYDHYTRSRGSGNKLNRLNQSFVQTGLKQNIKTDDDGLTRY